MSFLWRLSVRAWMGGCGCKLAPHPGASHGAVIWRMPFAPALSQVVWDARLSLPAAANLNKSRQSRG